MIEGTGLDYVVEGHGKPCLVLGSSIYYPRTFSKNLRKHLRLYFVDLRWFSKTYSEVPLRTYSLEKSVDDVDQIRKALKLDKVMLLGHSIHGTIAFEYAKRHPEHITRLVMIGAPSTFGNPEYDKLVSQAWKTASPERQNLQKSNWGHLPDFKKHPELQEDVETYLAMAPEYWCNPKYDARWIWKDMTIHSDLLHHLYDDLFHNYHMFGKPPRVPIPTFVAVGRYDFIVPPSLWERYSSVHNLKVCVFRKAGHTPQLEQPQEFDSRLLKWINRD